AASTPEGYLVNSTDLMNYNTRSTGIGGAWADIVVAVRTGDVRHNSVSPLLSARPASAERQSPPLGDAD
ncbi:MAG: hypothetical protein AAFY59_16930, partial [Pseudomonadota bacterium]